MDGAQRAGVAVAETDFGWPALRTVGEFDGRQKYGRLLSPGQDPGEVVYREKLREDEVRATGLGMVRWRRAHHVRRAPCRVGVHGRVQSRVTTASISPYGRSAA